MSSKKVQATVDALLRDSLHNLQGDIVAILDSDGNKVVEYKYDAWGKPFTPPGSMKDSLGKLNPFRYRGYVYDEETGLNQQRTQEYLRNVRDKEGEFCMSSCHHSFVVEFSLSTFIRVRCPSCKRQWKIKARYALGIYTLGFIVFSLLLIALYPIDSLLATITATGGMFITITLLGYVMYLFFKNKCNTDHIMKYLAELT